MQCTGSEGGENVVCAFQGGRAFWVHAIFGFAPPAVNNDMSLSTSPQVSCAIFSVNLCLKVRLQTQNWSYKTGEYHKLKVINSLWSCFRIPMLVKILIDFETLGYDLILMNEWQSRGKYNSEAFSHFHLFNVYLSADLLLQHPYHYHVENTNRFWNCFRIWCMFIMNVDFNFF